MLPGLIVTINNRVLPVAVSMCLALWISGSLHFSFEAEAEIFRWPFYKLQISVNVSLKKAQWIMLLTV
jgi:hypothetical protein